MTGRDVRAFVVSRDGTRLVAVVATTAGDRLMSADLLRTHAGDLIRPTPAHRISGLPDDLGRIVDLSWRSPNDLAVLGRSQDVSAGRVRVPGRLTRRPRPGAGRPLARPSDVGGGLARRHPAGLPRGRRGPGGPARRAGPLGLRRAGSPASAHRRTPADSRADSTGPGATARPRPRPRSTLDGCWTPGWTWSPDPRACTAGGPGRLLCPDCRGLLPDRAVWTSPDPCPPGLAPAVVGGDYADLLRAMVLAHKERRAFALVRPLGEVLAVAARDLVTARRADPPGAGAVPRSGGDRTRARPDAARHPPRGGHPPPPRLRRAHEPPAAPDGDRRRPGRAGRR